MTAAPDLEVQELPLGPFDFGEVSLVPSPAPTAAKAARASGRRSCSRS